MARRPAEQEALKISSRRHAGSRVEKRRCRLHGTVKLGSMLVPSKETNSEEKAYEKNYRGFRPGSRGRWDLRRCGSQAAGQEQAAQPPGDGTVRAGRRQVHHGGLFESTGQGTEGLWRAGTVRRSVARGRE